MSASPDRRAFLTLALLLSFGCGTPEAVPTEVPGELERLVLDTRSPEVFAAGHRRGALNLQLGWTQLEGRARAYAPDLDAPIAVRSSNDSEASEAARLLATLGYKDVALARASGESATLPLMNVAELEARLAAPDPPVVIDVRTPSEWATGTIDGAILVEQDAAPKLVPTLDPLLEYAIICEGGYRSSQLASLMARSGFARVHNVIDGMYAWRKRH